MLDFFGSIMSYIEVVWDFFLNLINSLLTFIDTLATAVTLPATISGFLWSPIASCMVSMVAFSVVKMIIGRSNA